MDFRSRKLASRDVFMQLGCLTLAKTRIKALSKLIQHSLPFTHQGWIIFGILAI